MVRVKGEGGPCGGACWVEKFKGSSEAPVGDRPAELSDGGGTAIEIGRVVGGASHAFHYLES